MTTSGTVSTTTFNTRRVIDRAFGRCKVVPEKISTEDIQTAQDNLFLLLSALVNRGILLWALERVVLPLYQNQAKVELPLGTVDLVSCNLRSLLRLSGTYATSAGGGADQAFDDDFDTACTQTSTDGNLRATFATATLVTTVGLLPNATATWALVLERSDDSGATWTTVLAPGSTNYVEGEWAWYDLDGSLAAVDFRVRETSGGTLDLKEVFLGNTPTEIPLARLNQDTYVALPNKTASGKPLQFWLDRQRGDSAHLAALYTWPVCDATNRYEHLVAWRKRYLQDVGTLAQEIEVPQRWYKYVVLALASEMADERGDVPPDVATRLEQKANSAWYEAQNEERDNSPFIIAPSISVYTR